MSIQASHIQAFLEATQALFESMIGLSVSFETPKVREAITPYDISGIIGLSGDLIGSVGVGFDRDSATGIVTAFTGEDLDLDSPDFADAIGEITNMIAGGAKAKFHGMSVSIGCPSVIASPSHRVSSPSAASSVTIPCVTPAGRFHIDISFRSAVAGAGQASHNAQARRA